MEDVEFSVLGGVRKKLKDMADGTHAEIVAAVAVDIYGNPVQFTDRELNSSRYAVKVAYTNAAVGDSVLKTTVLEVGGGLASVVAVLWENETPGTTIAAPPSISTYLDPKEASLAVLETKIDTLSTKLDQVIDLLSLAGAPTGYTLSSTSEVTNLLRLVNNTIQTCTITKTTGSNGASVYTPSNWV